MIGEWINQILSNIWTPVALAYFLGLLTGWLILRGANLGADAQTGADESESASADAPASMKIGALEAEIKKAKVLLEADAAEHAEFTEIISGLDNAIKRANGRLKLVLKSVKRVQNGG